MIEWATGVKMICMFFVSAILAKKGSVVAAVVQSIRVWVVFAENLEISLSLSNLAFDEIIDLYHS